MGIDGLSAVVARAVSGRASLGAVLDAVMSGVVEHRAGGVPEDDTLLLGLSLVQTLGRAGVGRIAVPAASVSPV